MRSTRSFVAGVAIGAAVVAVALVPRDGACDETAPLVGKPALDSLVKAANAAAKKGRRDEATEILDVFAKLHAAETDVAAARATCDRFLKAAKPAALPLPDVAKVVAKAAADVAAALTAVPEGARREIAVQILRLDASQRDARLASGQVECGGRWVPAAVVPCIERRKLVQDAVRRARTLDIPVEVGVSDNVVLEKVLGRKAVAVSAGDVSVHSGHLTPARCERQLREVMRAVALSNWLRTGVLAVPKTTRPMSLAFVDTKATYERAIVIAHATGEIDDRGVKFAQQCSGYIGRKHSLFRAEGEHLVSTHAMYHVLCHSLYDVDPACPKPQPALMSGLTNWLHINFLGVPMPGVGWIESAGGKPEGGRTSDDPATTAEREEYLRFARAGLAGSRLYMRWLARRGEDPPWSRSMVDEMGKITGSELAKCTLVADYLFETDAWETLRAKTSTNVFGTKPFEDALGAPLGEFEVRWREWLLADDAAPSLVDRLGAVPREVVTSAERAAIAYLDHLRRRAVSAATWPLGVDRELSDGCAAHARYLVRNPAQAAAWPDAHEEYPDKDGFSPAGSRAGLSSVIAPGSNAPQDAIDGWMATFYHRLPLLRPGLLRIGWGLEGGFAVLDSGSFVLPEDTPVHAVWPAPAAVGVPTRFTPELPNPVEGEDASRWGYPVTAQFHGFEPDPEVRLALYRGSRKDPATEVACHVSTPSKPTNPRLAPAGAFCLIPKEALKPGTTYTVVADGWPNEAKTWSWSFTTGTGK